MFTHRDWFLNAQATAILLLACAPAHGTLALLLPTKEGIVVCADRREWNRAEGPKDTNKIFALNRRVAFMVVGVARLSVSTPRALAPVYSISDSVQGFYARHKFVNQDSGWRRLASVLKQDFEDAYRKYNAPIEGSPGTTDDVVWEVDFLFATNRTPAVKQILYHSGGETTLNSLPEKPYITGQTAVSLRILRPQQYPDARFSDLRGDVRIARA
jgi:hypothetical protein